MILQSEIDAVSRHRKLKIFLIVITVIMIVAIFLSLKSQLFPHIVLKKVNKVYNPPVEREVHLEGAELEALMKSDTIEAQRMNSWKEIQSLQK